ncbi:MAG: 5-methyltetrahydrofolate:corrinoid/iron-sulfur protein co-methyltransferase [Pelotomaculum sp. PtaU1.Bin035]|nr:MAG: 5-methyltetrahydrofolate:corrinoid/iron-sulfur protein co-methyltransferase [Pelotomaculum sp. PtaU1.Bin035]
MILIGERINGMFKDIEEAILNRDRSRIEYWAKRQTDKGAHYLDINTGPAVAKEDQPAVMEWLTKVAQSVSPLPCCLDSASPDAIEAGLKVHRGKAIINSTTADEWKMDIYFPMAVRYNAYLIGLTMNEKGVPKSAAERVTLAVELTVGADLHNLPLEDLIIDPLVLPTNVAQDHGPEVIEALRQVKVLTDPPLRTVIGLSNVSQRCAERNLLNRTYMLMCMAAGLDCAIVNMDDELLVDAAAAGEILLNQNIYCDAFLKTFRKR